ncbi:MAG TPA: hypothetical protein VK116_04530, partial [Planctomycetota bacterium]|nr:hypothetical protein [Planctomycetota bacterium]
MIRVVPSLAVFAAVLATSFAFGQFVDDFERPDGPPDGWLPYQHNWVIESGGLVGTAAGGGAAGEAWAWAGDPPIRIVGDFTATFTIDFPVPSPEVGKHGGFSFFASEPTQRWATTWSGYTLDWIDRPDDFGFRLIRWDNGVASNLVIGTPTFFAPPFEW